MASVELRSALELADKIRRYSQDIAGLIAMAENTLDVPEICDNLDVVHQLIINISDKIEADLNL